MGDHIPPGIVATDRLDSWKEIATFLGRGVTTVQRWEETEGLPVRRHPHAKRGSVYASRAELVAWRERRVEDHKARAAVVPPSAASTRGAVTHGPHAAALAVVALSIVAVTLLGRMWRSRNE